VCFWCVPVLLTGGASHGGSFIGGEDCGTGIDGGGGGDGGRSGG